MKPTPKKNKPNYVPPLVLYPSSAYPHIGVCRSVSVTLIYVLVPSTRTEEAVEGGHFVDADATLQEPMSVQIESRIQMQGRDGGVSL